MFVRCVRATVVVLAIAWAGFAVAQDADPAALSAEDSGEETYAADPSESFIVEHSGQIAAAAPRPESPRPEPPGGERCREYSTSEGDGFEADGTGGLACPQPDGSWRIVSGSRDMIRPRQPEYPDYADDDQDERETVRPTRRFRLDWGAWSSARRGNAYRSYGYRNE